MVEKFYVTSKQVMQYVIDKATKEKRVYEIEIEKDEKDEEKVCIKIKDIGRLFNATII